MAGQPGASRRRPRRPDSRTAPASPARSAPLVGRRLAQLQRRRQPHAARYVLGPGAQPALLAAAADGRPQARHGRARRSRRRPSGRQLVGRRVAVDLAPRARRSAPARGGAPARRRCERDAALGADRREPRPRAAPRRSRCWPTSRGDASPGAHRVGERLEVEPRRGVDGRPGRPPTSARSRRARARGPRGARSRSPRAAPAAVPPQAEHGHVVGLGAAAGEDELLRGRVDDGRRPGAGAARGRLAARPPACGSDALPNRSERNGCIASGRRGQRGGRGVVEVDGAVTPDQAGA